MFSGFPPEALKFLRSLERNNRREWFQPRKETFDQKVKAPMTELVEAVNAELQKFAPAYINDPKKAVYRIYRDTRFSADKTPYKTHIAAVFPKRGMNKHAAGGFYFHLAPKAIGLAAGSYMPGPEELLAIRTWMLDHHVEFRKAARGPEKLWGKLHGEEMSRCPKGFDPAHPANDLIRRKSWVYWCEIDVALAESPQLQKEIVKRLKAAAPLVEMLNAPLTKALAKAKANSDFFD
jgi:uncharacterized protein (TIGR02453 family)